MNSVNRHFTYLGLVVGIVVLVGCDQAQTNPGGQGSPAAASSPLVTGAATPVNPEDSVPRIRAEDAMRMAKVGEAVLIDVRGTTVYEQELIDGALDYPLDKISTGDFKGLPRDKKIIAYCT